MKLSAMGLLLSSAQILADAREEGGRAASFAAEESEEGREGSGRAEVISVWLEEVRLVMDGSRRRGCQRDQQGHGTQWECTDLTTSLAVQILGVFQSVSG